ncbi:hypothetical protein H0H93_016166 [Arthromyces matolae]|nr:hypothetical protein H0H93_016166 [Arthromyces matolae]
MFSDSEGSEGGDLHNITINEHYAKAFEYKKEREELQKLKDKYGSDLDESDISGSDSESDETEDEDGEELTPTVDAAILRTLARIKRKDPAIYDSQTNIFGEEQQKVAPVTKRAVKSKDKVKPVTIRQMALESALDPNDQRSPSPEPLTHVQEQSALRDETIAAFHNAVEDQDDDNFLIPREKTKDEQQLEEEEYRSFLEREVGGDLKELVDIGRSDVSQVAPEEAIVNISDTEKQSKKKKKPKKAAKEASVQPRTESDQDFLMNYILNRGWIDRSKDYIPTYGEITSAQKTQGKKKIKDDEVSEAASQEDEPDPGEELPTVDPDIDEDDFEEIVDRFESSYNFRFEEPDAAIIPSYPRNLPSLVRREDNTRKEARERRKQRKAEELEKKKEDVRRLKGLKMKEIRSRLERIGREGGKSFEDNQALQDLDLDADWDSGAHDRQMAALYDENDVPDEEKPQWDDDIDIGDIPLDDGDQPVKQKKKKKKKSEEVEQEDIGVDMDAMDADVEQFGDDDEWDGTEEMRKRKLEEYMDEIYGLDFNDLVGGIPTRFKYIPVQSDAYALTPVEILMATDQELNEYVGIKKFAPYRQGSKWDTKRNDRLMELRAKMAERTGKDIREIRKTGGHNGAEEGDRPAKKRKGKKERMKLKVAAGAEDEDETAQEALTVDPQPSSKRKRGEDAAVVAREDEERPEEGAASKKKRRRKQKKENTS